MGNIYFGCFRGSRATSPTIMWVKALDILMEKLRICGVDFSEVKKASLTAALPAHNF